LWSGLDGETKFHLVNWKKFCTPIRFRVLGIKSLTTFNLGKWLWWFAVEKEVFWFQIVDKKYGSLVGRWCTKGLTGTYGVSLWKHIRRGWVVFYYFSVWK
jgi:hypothetical protein